MNVRPILTIAVILPLASAILRAEYTDHRRKNLDSLENVVVKYTPDRIENATEEELSDLINAYDNLMNGYLQINRERSILFARKQIWSKSLTRRRPSGSTSGQWSSTTAPCSTT